MRASRLVSMLLLLQTRGQLTAAQLAAELEVSERTVYRDVGALTVAGVPIRSITGPVGGYRLLDGYRTRLTGLSAEEAESLFVASIPDVAADLGLIEASATAQLKLLAALPAAHRERAVQVSRRFHFDAPDWYADPDETSQLPAVIDALSRQHRLWVRYRRWTAPRDVERVIEPLGVVLKAGRWYVVAAVAGGQLRTYRVARILASRLLDETFARPEGFDLPAYWKSYLADLQGRLRCETAVIRLSQSGVELLPDLLDPVVVRAVSDTAGLPDADGWVEAVIPVEGQAHATTELLRLGPEVEVVAPAGLRENMARATREMAARYVDLPR